MLACTEANSTDANVLAVGLFNSKAINSTGGPQKAYGIPVRCVKNK